MKRLCNIALAFMVGMLVLEGRLNAATYEFDPTIVVNNPSNPPDFDYTQVSFPVLSISIEDSAIQTGSFSTTYTSNPANFVGNYDSLISFSIGNFVSLLPNPGNTTIFRANLLFNTDGSVSAGALYYSNDQFQIDFAGSADLFQGVFIPSGGGYQGFVSGTLTAVPEPISLILLSAGVFGLGLIRRRSR